MTIKVRKEGFGYVLFRQKDRKYFIVEKDFGVQNLSSLVTQYFPEVGSSENIVVVPTGNFQKEMNLSSPIGMYLEISPKCNLNCGHCYKPRDVGYKEMTLKQTEDLIDELSAMGVFLFIL